MPAKKKPTPRPEIEENDVFLNVPFDSRYEPLFIGLIAGLTALGRRPRCVLEIPDSGPGFDRLSRIYSLMAGCGVSIHDLSRVSLSGVLRVPRFNMPFELGLAYAIARVQKHSLFVFESRAHRLGASLSDWKHDPKIHESRQDEIANCLLDCLGAAGHTPSPGQMQGLAQELSRTARKLKRESGSNTLYSGHRFRQLNAAAIDLAVKRGVLGP